MDYNSILGAVLAGGKSKRFGKDKTQVSLNGKRLIDYILNEIKDQFKEIVVISNNNIKLLNLKHITKIEDYKKDLGPLGGVLSAMKWVKENKKNYEWICTFPADTPFFKKEHLQAFMENINFKESQLFFISSNNTRHNIFGLWSVKLIDQLEDDLLNKDLRKVEIWANKIGVKVINMNFREKDPFFNINTNEDLDKAEQLIKHD